MRDQVSHPYKTTGKYNDCYCMVQTTMTRAM
jgi:hypothetical protein